MDTLLSRITIDPAICHGKPCVRGLRYPVETLLELLSSGMTIDEILADYEDLAREDLLAVLAFAARLERREIVRLFNQLCCQPLYQFPLRRAKLCAPFTLGVYVIRDAAKRVVHVGRTPRAKKGLHKRLCDHLSGASSFTNDYLKGDGSQLRGAYSFQYLEVADARKRALLEAFAIGWLCPLHLGLGEGVAEEAEVDPASCAGGS
jgi:uncharacterized protein (DUF433 family)